MRAERAARDPAMVGKAARGPRWLAERAREFVGTGLLQVAIRSDGDDSCRRTAKDTTTSSLEEKIPSVLNEFVAALDRRRKQRKNVRNGRASSACASAV